MIRATVAAGGRGQLVTMTRLTLRLEMGLGATMEQHIVTSSSLPPALRARQGNNRCSRGQIRTQGALLRRCLPATAFGSFQQTQKFSASATVGRSKQRQSGETQGDKVTISPALLLHLQARLEKWHLSSSGRSSRTSRGYDMSAEERQEHLDLAQMELKWMMDQVYASVSATASTSTSQGQIRSQEDELSLRRALGGHLKDMVRRRVVDHEPLAYILG
ncbi:hypothetical protein BCV69DRAFT_147000 [Microstroma glucosiphilum]|uniref:Uncharacterized protein n=1 Tax=Pseudomicrostroma glucosiphilum TaxID=1684307 RepID=A0A316UBK5_9BASI|nr:hypothetical protein BCV69DRAFT_147000 [Pseudomicrostroma glucosiphilum]PWN22542.1 hypothetical protein BCV69DRAFT_147000 [Pseudomicrostroma glucosiphilum]